MAFTEVCIDRALGVTTLGAEAPPQLHQLEQGLNRQASLRRFYTSASFRAQGPGLKGEPYESESNSVYALEAEIGDGSLQLGKRIPEHPSPTPSGMVSELLLVSKEDRDPLGKARKALLSEDAGFKVGSTHSRRPKRIGVVVHRGKPIKKSSFSARGLTSDWSRLNMKSSMHKFLRPEPALRLDLDDIQYHVPMFPYGGVAKKLPADCPLQPDLYSLCVQALGTEEKLKTLVKANGAPGASGRMLGLLRQKLTLRVSLLAAFWAGRRQANEGRHGGPTTRSKAL
uniref:Uncharacterized protein n=1 Tax=Oryza nivara TaxID=4536 RepID=A0A0E0FUQ1_ORYNI